MVFALLCTGYIFVGVRLEEKDLEHALPEYRQYKKEVPMFMPKIRRNPAQDIGFESVLKRS